MSLFIDKLRARYRQIFDEEPGIIDNELNDINRINDFMFNKINLLIENSYITVLSRKPTDKESKYMLNQISNFGATKKTLPKLILSLSIPDASIKKPVEIQTNIYITSFAKDTYKYDSLKLYLSQFNIRPTLYTMKNYTDAIIQKNYNINVSRGGHITSASSYSQLLAHLAILKEARSQNLDRVIICSDNILLCHDFTERITKIPNTCDVLYLGAYQKEYTFNKATYYDGYYKAIYTYGTFAYMINKNFYDTLISYYEMEQNNLDYILVQLQEKHTFYVMFPNLIIEDLKTKDFIDTGRIITVSQYPEIVLNNIFKWEPSKYNTTKRYLAKNDTRIKLSTCKKPQSVVDNHTKSETDKQLNVPISNTKSTPKQLKTTNNINTSNKKILAKQLSVPNIPASIPNTKLAPQVKAPSVSVNDNINIPITNNTKPVPKDAKLSTSDNINVPIANPKLVSTPRSNLLASESKTRSSDKRIDAITTNSIKSEAISIKLLNLSNTKTQLVSENLPVISTKPSDNASIYIDTKSKPDVIAETTPIKIAEIMTSPDTAPVRIAENICLPIETPFTNVIQTSTSIVMTHNIEEVSVTFEAQPKIEEDTISIVIDTPNTDSALSETQPEVEATSIPVSEQVSISIDQPVAEEVNISTIVEQKSEEAITISTDADIVLSEIKVTREDTLEITIPVRESILPEPSLSKKDLQRIAKQNARQKKKQVLQATKRLISKSLLKPGISFIIHSDINHDNSNLHTCIETIVTIANEILFFNNNNNVNALDILKPFNNVFIHNYPNSLNTIETNNDVYLNWCLSKVKTYNVIEWNCHYIPIKENILDMIEKYNLRNKTDPFLLLIAGKRIYISNSNNFLDVQKCLYVRMYSKLHKFTYTGTTESKDYLNLLSQVFIHQKLSFLDTVCI